MKKLGFALIFLLIVSYSISPPAKACVVITLTGAVGVLITNPDPGSLFKPPEDPSTTNIVFRVMVIAGLTGAVAIELGLIHHPSELIMGLDEPSREVSPLAIIESLRSIYPKIQDHSVYTDLASVIHSSYLQTSETVELVSGLPVKEIRIPAEQAEKILTPAGLSESDQARIIRELSI